MESHILSRHFTLPKLLKFVFPTIIMMIFMSVYTSVDGAFVSHLISEDALAAVNVVYPVFSVILALGLMFATGSNAIIARKLGEKRPDEAMSFLTLIYICGVLLGTFITAIGLILREPVLAMLGAQDTLYEYASSYYSMLVLFAPMSFLQVFAQNFFVTEGKPSWGLALCAAGGIANIILDYVFIVFTPLGIAGAALATGIGYSIPGVVGVIYFAFNKKGNLHFRRPVCKSKEMLHTCTNGSSELVNNLSIAITTLLFNLTMLRQVGKSGVAAITVILYIQFIQAAVYFGYSQGVAPVISYKYGEANHEQLKYIMKMSIRLILGASFLVVGLSVLFSETAVSLFLSKDSEIFDMTNRGFLIFATSYIFMGLNVFYSAMFTALGNGKISALLSFLRTLVFIVGALLILPQILGVDGIWLAVPLAEALAFAVGIIFYKTQKKRYHY